ncbi:MAG: DUF1559 domain-containing protein, partial [Planctomycetaceae bacterium]|nr:DUF1559 domain-containing protein [Planctomycetaceae bacterium]
IIAGCLVLIFWALVFFSSDRPKTFKTLAAIAALGGILYVLLMPVQQVRVARQHFICKSNLKQITLALHNYHEINGCFPPAYVSDRKGKPLYSWRVLLLPDLDRKKLYEEFDLSKPWDSPENLKLLSQMPECYGCPTEVDWREKPTTTSYLAVVGEHTAWPFERSTQFSDFTDGTPNTILVMESRSQIPWTAPQDLTLPEAVSQWAIDDNPDLDGHRSEDLFHESYYGRSVAFADGRVGVVGKGLDPQLATQVLTIDDGEPPEDVDLFGTINKPVVRTKWGNVMLLVICILLTVLPVRWVWSRESKMEAKSLREKQCSKTNS